MLPHFLKGKTQTASRRVAIEEREVVMDGKNKAKLREFARVNERQLQENAAHVQHRTGQERFKTEQAAQPKAKS